jgi:hypothetical protein
MQWIPAEWNLPIIKISGEGVFETKENCAKLNTAFTKKHNKNCVIIFEGMEYTPSEDPLYSPCSELIQHLISEGYYVYAFVRDTPPEGWKVKTCYFSKVPDPSETTTKLMNVEYNLGNFRKKNLSIDKYKDMSVTVVDMDLVNPTKLDMQGDIESQLGDNYICVIKQPLDDDSGGLAAGGGSLAAGGTNGSAKYGPFRSRKDSGNAQKESKQKVSKQRVSKQTGEDLQQLTQSINTQLAPYTSSGPLGVRRGRAADALSASLPTLSGIPPPPGDQTTPPPPGTSFGGTIRRKPKSNLTRRVR